MHLRIKSLPNQLVSLTQLLFSNPPYMPFKKEELTPAGLKLFALLKERLPPDIASRLRSQRVFTTHGTRKSQYLFDIWDSGQNGVLPRNYFKYCLAYDYLKLNDRRHDGYFHLWLSTVRIYRERDGIKRLLEREIPKVAPRGFKLEFCEDRAISCGKVFNWPTDPIDAAEQLVEGYVRLISSVHPVLMPIVDRFSAERFTSTERKASVKARGRVLIRRRGGAIAADKLRQYSRSIPKSWRVEILEKNGYACVHCGTDLKNTKSHIDHIVPFSKGGDTVLSNLQPLCAACNLAKGNRVADTETRSHVRRASRRARTDAVQDVNPGLVAAQSAQALVREEEAKDKGLHPDMIVNSQPKAGWLSKLRSLWT